MLTDSMDPPPASPPTFSKYWVLLHECRRPIQMHYNIWGDQCSQYRYPRGFFCLHYALWEDQHTGSPGIFTILLGPYGGPYMVFTAFA